MNESSNLRPSHQQFYALQEMAQLLSLRVRQEGEEMRTTVDKVRKRLIYAVDKGDLQLMGAGALQLFFAAQVFAWARRKWPGAFEDISGTHEVKAESGFRLGVTARAFEYPGNLDKCHTVLRSAYDEIELLKEELDSADRELARLRPLAERYEENREKNRRAAKRPRKDV